MSAQAFPLTRVASIILCAIVALIGLFAASRATDVGFSLFGYGMIVFGYAFGFWMLKRGLDAADHPAG